MHVNDLIDKIISKINWLEAHPTPINFIEMRNLLNHELRQAIDSYVADELAKTLLQLAPSGIGTVNKADPVVEGQSNNNKVSSQEETH